MDAFSVSALELGEILEQLRAETSTPQGDELAAALSPTADAADVATRQSRTAEALELARLAVVPGLVGAVSIAAAAEQAQRGAVLDTSVLRAVAVTAAVGLAAAEAVGRAEDVAPLLAGVLGEVDRGLGRLVEELERCVAEDGSALRDGASPALAELRRELRSGRARVAEDLRRYARSSDVREHLQEDFVTERAGRPVVAVRVEARGRVPGIVHDTSASGQTLFVEPFAIVDANNRLRELAGRERAEAERLTAALSALVGANAVALGVLDAALAKLDLACACAALARRWDAVAVEVGADVELTGVRHPLLDPGLAVPIDLELAEGTRALVISGPNTGGKSVALKTLGLAVLLHQSGLRVPAVRAVLPLFDQVLVDIGDAQSIAMSLSTFSGHLRTLVSILERANDRSLVLLDEVAAGTDPVEGAALAQALLERLASQARLTVATSHYEELKQWASVTAGAVNAATGFDAVSHAPLYLLALGRPGTSHALQIAERLGLDARVVAAARARLGDERRRLGELLAQAERAEQEARADRQTAAEERASAQAQLEALQGRERELETEIERVRASAQRERERAIAEAERDLAEARAELASLREQVRTARRAERERRRGDAVPHGREADRDRALGAADERADEAARLIAELATAPTPATPLTPGDAVVAPALGLRGTIAAIEGDDAIVDGDRGLRVRVDIARLRSDPQALPRSQGQASVHLTRPRENVGSELDVRGRRADEARELVREWVDSAALAGLVELRLVHGRGTGAVRAAVRQELERHPLVDRFEATSADGATDVWLGDG